MRTILILANLTAAVLLALLPGVSSAGLLVGVSFDRQLYVNTNVHDANAVRLYALPFAGTSLPASGSRVVVAGDGGYASAAFDFDDNGFTAEFRIELYEELSSDMVVNEVSTGEGNPGFIEFTTTVPVNYLIVTTGNAGGILIGPGLFEEFGRTHPAIVSGTLQGNTHYYVNESQSWLGGTPHLSSFDLALTAVPEPSTFMLLSIGAIGLAAVARHKMRQRKFRCA